MIFRSHTDYTPVLHQRLLDGMPYTQYCSSGNSSTCQVLIEATYIDDAGHCRSVVERNFSAGGDKRHFGDRVVEMLWDSERLHITNPAPTTSMYRIANLVLA